MGHVFVSYSRSEFYHAESVTAVINQMGGTRAWLDVENLRPGMDWAAGITSALDTADTLLLMASPAALRSAYVQAEWTRALAAGKPVHVAVVRGVSLPAQLAHCPKHDLRVGFWSRSRRVAAELNGRAPASPTTVRLRPVVPFAVLALMAVLFFGVAMAGAFTLVDWDAHGRYAGRSGQLATGRTAAIFARYALLFLVLMVCNLVAAAGLVTLFVRLLNRNATPTSLRNGFGAFFAIMGSDQVFLELTDNTAIRMYGIAVMGAAAAGAILVSRSPTVHLWMPTGEGSDHIRQRILGRAVRRRRELVRGSGRQWGIYRPRFAALAESLAGIGSATSYDIVHLPADRQIANLLDGACKLAGFDRDSVDPHWTFVLVSAYSDWSMLAAAQQILGDRVVFVLASGVRLPPGIDADAELIRRNQWLDFRDQSPVMLYELLRSVVFARPDIPSPVTVPADIKRFHGPGYLTRFLGWTQVTTAVVVVEPLGLLVANSSPLLPTLAITIVATVLIALAWRLAWRTAARQITAQRWRRHAWLIVAAFVAWALLFPPASAMPPAWRVLSSVLLRIVVPVITVSSLPSYGRNFRLLWLPPAELTGSAGMIGPARPQLFSYPLIAATVAFMAPAVFLSPLPSTP